MYLKENIARGTTDPAYWLFNLQRPDLANIYNAIWICSHFGHQVALLALARSLATRWRHLQCHISYDCPIYWNHQLVLSCYLPMFPMLPMFPLPNRWRRWLLARELKLFTSVRGLWQRDLQVLWRVGKEWFLTWRGVCSWLTKNLRKKCGNLNIKILWQKYVNQ